MRLFVALGFSLVGLSFVACRSSGPVSPALPPPATPPAVAATVLPPPAPADKAGKVSMAVTDEGFEPSRIPAKKGQPITIAITRKTDHTCAREIMFQGQDGKTALPLGKTVEVTYTPKASGEIKFGCAMGMMVSGVLAVSE
jgi:plastocyanin